jgi:hypothetical protein
MVLAMRSLPTSSAKAATYQKFFGAAVVMFDSPVQAIFNNVESI